MMRDRGRPMPAPGQWWRLMAHEGVITKILPGGAGGAATSARIVMSIRSQNPAIASSTELSTTSHTRW